MTLAVLNRPPAADTNADIVAAASAELARIVDELTRLGFLAGGLGSAALLGLGACGSSSGATSDGSSSGPAEWTFTDDLSRKVTCPATPRRIAVLDDTVAEPLVGLGLSIVATLGLPGNRAGLNIAGVPATVTSVGNGDGTVNAEKLADARPDLIIDSVYNGKLAYTSQNPRLADIAPVLGFNTNKDFNALMADGARLLDALHVATPHDVTAARSRYQSDAAALRAALAAKPGLRLAVCSASTSNLFLIIWYGVLPLPTNPGFTAMPAVAAGQVFQQGSELDISTYAVWADLLPAVTASKPSIGPR